MGIKLFLDSVSLISGVLASNDGHPMRRIVALGAMNVLDLRICYEVQGDVERFCNNRDPGLRKILASLIVAGNIATVPDPNKETVDKCTKLTGYAPDARILAAALECAADILVTHDKQHLLGNAKIKPPEAYILVMNPQDALAWCADEWMTSMRDQK